MLEMIKKFFGFCNNKNRNKFYKAIVLGVIEAMLNRLTPITLKKANKY